MSSTSSAGRSGQRAGSAKVISTARSPRRLLVRNREIESESAREIAHPRPRFFIRADNNRSTVNVRAQRIRDRRHGRKVVSLNTRKDVAKVGGSMQMGIDRNNAIEGFRQQFADDLLADRLALTKRRVLPHVAKVGSNEDQSLGAAAAQGFAGEQQCQQLYHSAEIAMQRRPWFPTPGRRSRAIPHPESDEPRSRAMKFRAAPQAGRQHRPRTGGIAAQSPVMACSRWMHASRPHSRCRPGRPPVPVQIAHRRRHECGRAARPVRRGRRSS